MKTLEIITPSLWTADGLMTFNSLMEHHLILFAGERGLRGIRSLRRPNLAYSRAPTRNTAHQCTLSARNNKPTPVTDEKRCTSPADGLPEEKACARSRTGCWAAIGSSALPAWMTIHSTTVIRKEFVHGVFPAIGYAKAAASTQDDRICENVVVAVL